VTSRLALSLRHPLEVYVSQENYCLAPEKGKKIN